MNENYVVSIDNLEELWRVGAVNLPNVAVQYSEAAIEVHKCGLSDNQLFNRSEGGMSPLSKVFIPMRNEFQDKVLVKTQTSLQNAGTVVCKIADSFATTDFLTADKLNEYSVYKEDINDGKYGEDDQPPSYIPSPPKSTDPHPEEQPHLPGGR